MRWGGGFQDWRDLTAETRFRSRASPCEVCGGQSGIERQLSIRVMLFFPCCYPSVFTTCSSTCSFYQKDKRSSPGNFQIKFCSGNPERWKETCLVDYIGDSGEDNNGFLIARASPLLPARSHVFWGAGIDTLKGQTARRCIDTQLRRAADTDAGLGSWPLCTLMSSSQLSRHLSRAECRVWKVTVKKMLLPPPESPKQFHFVSLASVHIHQSWTASGMVLLCEGHIVR